MADRLQKMVRPGEKARQMGFDIPLDPRQRGLAHVRGEKWGGRHHCVATRSLFLCGWMRNLAGSADSHAPVDMETFFRSIVLLDPIIKYN